ncbi:MAG: hypothetical protein EA402_07520, partial [Planctomycetota bacterium]
MELTALFNRENPAARLNTDNSSAFRDADFLSIMLAELSNQDPFEPMETSKLVENMQKLQELSNTRFERYRNDLRWSQELIGQEVTVNQNALREQEVQALRNRGFNPDVGYGVVTGTVSGYRTMGETVWITIDNKDYKLDNVQRIEPKKETIDGKIDLANNLLGFFVTYSADTQGANGAGLVEDVQWDSSGEVFI